MGGKTARQDAQKACQAHHHMQPGPGLAAEQLEPGQERPERIVHLVDKALLIISSPSPFPLRSLLLRL